MTLPFIAPPAWWIQARCRLERITIDVFYPTNTPVSPFPICAGCDARWHCLTDGLEEDYGVWGGHTARERQRIKNLLAQGANLRDASRVIEGRRQPHGA